MVAVIVLELQQSLVLEQISFRMDEYLCVILELWKYHLFSKLINETDVVAFLLYFISNNRVNPSFVQMLRTGDEH